MKQSVFILLMLGLFAGHVCAQDRCTMYNINNKIDIPVTAIGVAGTGYGLYKRFKKPETDSAVILALNTDKMNRWNKAATQHYNKGQVSNALFVLGVTSPWVLFSDKDIKKDNGKIGMMYMEVIGLSSMGYALTAGTVNKYRPYAYNSSVPMKRRCSSHAKNSFYCGHPSVMAAGSFFTAKVYSDYHPKTTVSRALWTYAVASTLTCGYLRFRGGYHFPSDVVLGMATGTAIGVLVPTLHKNRKHEGGDNASQGMDTGCQRIGVVISF